MASIIHEEMFEVARELGLRRYKIASRTVIEKPELVEKVLAEDKETFVSLGWWEKEGRTGWPFGPPSSKLRYIYCKSKYPAYPGDLAGCLPERFSEDGFYGYSDHTHGIEACLVAAARGARFLEKHFTLDKTIVSVHNDHVLSADPRELAELCRHAHAIGRLVRALEGDGPAPGGVPPITPLA
jgi:sialic acid synthase SpsE